MDISYFCVRFMKMSMDISYFCVRFMEMANAIFYFCVRFMEMAKNTFRAVPRIAGKSRACSGLIFLIIKKGV